MPPTFACALSGRGASRGAGMKWCSRHTAVEGRLFTPWRDKLPAQLHHAAPYLVPPWSRRHDCTRASITRRRNAALVGEGACFGPAGDEGGGAVGALDRPTSEAPPIEGGRIIRRIRVGLEGVVWDERPSIGSFPPDRTRRRSAPGGLCRSLGDHRRDDDRSGDPRFVAPRPHMREPGLQTR